MVLVTSPAVSLAKFGVSFLSLRETDFVACTDDSGKITRAKELHLDLLTILRLAMTSVSD